MAGDKEYTAAANAVRAGTATPTQQALNDKMAKQSRRFSTLAGQAQDAAKEAKKS